jgi:hypothetical protein
MQLKNSLGFLVAYNMCNDIKHVAKEKNSFISYTNVGWFTFFGENFKVFSSILSMKTKSSHIS